MQTLSSAKKIFFISLSLLLIFFAYSNHFNNPFEFDDEHTIVNNTAIRDIKNIFTFFKDASTTSSLPPNQAYRPGLTTLNAIDYAIGNSEIPQPFFYHVSIFISLLCIWFCLYLLGLKWFKNYSQSFWWSLVLATLFSIHTANSVTINYIIARADSFSTLMILLAFVLYLHSSFCKKYFIYMIPVIIGFFVKEPAVVFIPLLMFYKLLFERDKDKIGSVFNLPSIIAVLKQTFIPLVTIIVLVVFSRKMTPEHWTPGEIDGYRYMISQPFVIVHYFNNFFLPFNLVIDTDWDFVKTITDDKVIVGLVFITLMLVVIIKSAKKHSLLSFGLAWFLIALLPTSLVPLSEVLNDHRPFLAYIGLSISFVYGLIILFEKKNIKLNLALKVAIPILILLHGLGTYHQCAIWNSSQQVWQEATVKAPRNGRAWMNYGLTLMQKGNYAEAETAYVKASELLPYYSYVYINLGILKGELKNDTEAEAYFKKALSLSDNNPEIYYFYGKFLSKRSRMSEAKYIVNNGLLKSPYHANLNQLNNELKTQGNDSIDTVNTSITKELKAVEQQPTAENYLNLSLAHYNSGNYQDCIIACEKALKLKPDYALAYNNICSSYNQLKQWDNAIEAGERGLLLDPKNKLLIGNLKVAIEGKKNKQ